MNKNSQDLTKEQVNRLYPDKITEKRFEINQKILNKHEHWLKDSGMCRICGRRGERI